MFLLTISIHDARTGVNVMLNFIFIVAHIAAAEAVRNQVPAASPSSSSCKQVGHKAAESAAVQ